MELSQQYAPGYRPEVDGLRCVAVLPVIFYHAAFPFFSGGYVGVDVFYVISGYLITSIILADLGKGRFSFGNFYERRVRRIFPALFLVTAFTCVGAWFALTPLEMRSFGQSVVATMAFASNILFYLKSGYFAADVDTYPLIHMWSLSVEEQFYIVFPILLLALTRLRQARRTLVLAIVFVVTLAACILMQPRDPSAAFFLTPFRAWELVAGAMIAVNDSRWRGFIAARPRLGLPIELTGLALIAGSIILLDQASPFPGWLALAPVLGTAFIILASSPRTPVGRLLSTKPLVAIGLLSYSAYLWHQPLFALARSYHGLPLATSAYWAMIALTFLLSWLSWRFVETPFRNRAFLSRRTLFGWAVGLSGLLIALGAAAHLTQGFPNRFPPDRVAIARTAELSPVRVDCHTDGLDFRAPRQACRYFTPRAEWAVLGDSHAIELGYALAERLRPGGGGVLHLSFSSCPPALDFDPPAPGCRAWLRESLALLAERPEVTNVMLSFRHSLYLYGDQRTDYPRAAREPPRFLPEAGPEQAREAYWRDFEALVARLRAAGKRVFLVGPVPELPTSVQWYVFRAPPGAQVPAEFFVARQGEILRRLRVISGRHGATLIEPHRALCTPQSCAVSIAGVAMYFDDNHLSVPGARRVLAREAGAGRLP